MTRTALGAAFEVKGVNSRNVALQIAIAKFQNNGGEWGVAMAMLNAAYGRGREGQRSRAENGQSSDADASREVGLVVRADGASSRLPTSQSSRAKPGHARRGATAIASVQSTVGKSLFDSVTLPDGRKLGEVRWSECPALATKYRRTSRILMAVHNHAIPADPNTRLDAVVNDAELTNIIAAVERFNEIH